MTRMHMNRGRISFLTLGCRLNQSETAVLEGLFRERGCRLVPFGEAADVAVINTCTVTAAGDRDARKAVYKAVRANPGVRIAMIGCQAQTQREALFQWPQVRWVVGTAEKMHLVDIVLDSLVAAKAPALIVPPIPRKSFLLPIAVETNPRSASRTRAGIKVQDGCDNFCAYCDIPYARGRSRSRIFENLMEEAHALAAAGYREVVITGVNVGDYDESGKDLVDIVAGMEKIAGIERIRISSIEHTTLPLQLVKFMRPPHKLCRFLHIPVQSGCDRVLKRMGRRYTCADVEALMIRLTGSVGGLMLGTDVIVGFPGESEEDFKETYAFLEKMPFGYFHVFPYSNRQRARSRNFKGAVPSREISRRSALLRALSSRKRQAFLQTLLGTTQAVLFEQKKNDYWIGHTDNYVTIKTRSSDDLRNRIVFVTLDSIDQETITTVSAHDPSPETQKPHHHPEFRLLQ